MAQRMTDFRPSDGEATRRQRLKLAAAQIRRQQTGFAVVVTLLALVEIWTGYPSHLLGVALTTNLTRGFFPQWAAFGDWLLTR